MNVPETVLELLGQILSRDTADFPESYPLTSTRDVTPLDIAKLAIACEEAFSLTLHDEIVARWATLGDVYACIELLLQSGEAEPTERSDEERTQWFYEY